MAKNEVNILVKLKDQATRGIKALTKNFGRLKASVKQVRDAVLKFTVAAGAMAFAIKKAADRANQLAGVQRAFGKQVGNTETAMLRLRTASKGLINDYDLMTGFNRALTLGSARNEAEFAKLTRTAISLGRALGVDAAFALESLNLGIGRQSRLILDNLGLIVKVEEANRKYAESLGKTIEELTEAEKRTAFVTEAFRASEEAIGRLGEAQDTAADSIVRMFIALQNLRDEFLLMLADAPRIQALFDTMGDWVSGLTGGPTLGQQAAAGATQGRFSEAIDAAENLNQLAAVRELIEADIAGHQAIEAANAEKLLEFEQRRKDILKEMQGQPGGARPGWSKSIDANIAETAGNISGEQFMQTMLNQLLKDIVNKVGAMANTAAAAAGDAARARGIASRPIGFVEGSLGQRDYVGDFFRGRQKLHAEREALMAGRKGMITPPDVKALHSRPVEEAAVEFEGAANMAVASFGAMAEAAIRGSEITAESVIGMLTRIVQSLPGVGGLAGSIIGAVGGIFGAFAGAGRRQKIVPVSLERVSPQASNAIGPSNVSIQIVSPTTGAVLEELEYQLGRRARRDAVTRIPRSAADDWVRGGG